MNLITSAPDLVRSPAAEKAAAPSATSALPIQAMFMAGFLGLAFVWAFWPALCLMADRWLHDAQYSHGILVPVFALVVLWLRRGEGNCGLRIADCELENKAPSLHPQSAIRNPQLVGWPSAWGLGFLIVGASLRLNSARLDFDAMDAVALLPMLAGMALLVGGWPMLRWTWPAIAYLGFMLPLPFAIEQGLSQPLRKLATMMSTFLLETLGLPAVAEGHIILIDDVQLKVAEACSGLGMLMTFFALSTAMAMLVRRNWIDRLVIVASAIPIAVLANVLRITTTGVAYVWISPQAGQFFMHDLAGWLMMPVALLMLWWEIRLIDLLFRPGEESAPLRMVPGKVGRPS